MYNLVKVLMQLFDQSKSAGIESMVMRWLMKWDELHVPAALESFYKIPSKAVPAEVE